MGGHGRALELLQDVLHRHRDQKTDAKALVEAVDNALQPLLADLFASRFFLDVDACQGVLIDILSCRGFYIADTYHFEDLRRLGFFRLDGNNAKKRLGCAFLVFSKLLGQLARLLGDDGEFEESLARIERASYDFDELMVFHLQLKTLVYRNKRVLLSIFHAGTGMERIDSVSVYDAKMRKVVAMNKSNSGGGTLDAIVVDSSSKELVVGYHNNGEPSKDVIRWHVGPPDEILDEALYTAELKKANVVVDSDVFVLVTTARVSEEFDLPPCCGLVTGDMFGDYFGPLASLVELSLEQ
ncbi:hypothetical protein Poli38472_013439 [Pythium oligandrum]|uniref:Uncharacterized protein n=1 Tax=Pythium oligandrum TaxID=41045 RepID=A0A8K1C803_PYTOL|nr:hypothetical protein Poli38472_013439 [Pythium oligandrum]|eukprot:TMW57965.1 hypothetical protein Poli38472_013439 [Pythium oligandrum]